MSDIITSHGNNNIFQTDTNLTVVSHPIRYVPIYNFNAPSYKIKYILLFIIHFGVTEKMFVEILNQSRKKIKQIYIGRLIFIVII